MPTSASVADRSPGAVASALTDAEVALYRHLGHLTVA